MKKESSRSRIDSTQPNDGNKIEFSNLKSELFSTVEEI